MVEVLLRELRDIVYSYIHAGQPIQAVGTISLGPGDNIRDRDKPVFREYWGGPPFEKDARYFKSDYVGDQFLYEILEQWYRNSIFSINNAQAAKRFCAKNQGGAGVIPAQCIQNIFLRLGHNASFPGSAEAAVIHVKDSVKALRPLFSCRSRVIITIEVSNPYGLRRQGCKRWRGPPKGFQADPWRISLVRKIFPTLRRLVEQGHVVHLVFEKRTHLCTTFEDFSEKSWIKVVERTAYRSHY
jgi:hypothetical protein